MEPVDRFAVAPVETQTPDPRLMLTGSAIAQHDLGRVIAADDIHNSPSSGLWSASERRSRCTSLWVALPVVGPPVDVAESVVPDLAHAAIARTQRYKAPDGSGVIFGLCNAYIGSHACLGAPSEPLGSYPTGAEQNR
jgi:hypothetical protein